MTGEPCNFCPGHLVVVNSERRGDRMTRRYACHLCRRRPQSSKTVGDAKPKRKRRIARYSNQEGETFVIRV